MNETNSLLEKNIIGSLGIRKILNYIRMRECINGGYCFYRQEEPNASDTFFAFASQNLLINNFKGSPTTISYLENLQNPDGSYFSIIQAYYTVKALSILDSSPTVDASWFILKNFQSFNKQNLPTEISVYRKVYFLVCLASELKIPLSSELAEKIIDFIFLFKNQDFGFGNSNKSTLIETMQALQILKSLNYPINNIRDLDIFISKCISPNLLYTNMPEIYPSFIEHVNAGYVISRIIAQKPDLLATSLKFIKGCQTSLGGFSRAPFTGIASLEYTYYAVNTLRLIADWM